MNLPRRLASVDRNAYRTIRGNEQLQDQRLSYQNLPLSQQSKNQSVPAAKLDTNLSGSGRAWIVLNADLGGRRFAGHLNARPEGETTGAWDVHRYAACP